MGAVEVIAFGESRRQSSAEFVFDRHAGGRRLLVGMKLNTSCREMLTWTIAKLAQPGDHILALHVSSQQGVTVDEEYSRTQQLANTLRGVLSVYESLCNLEASASLSIKLRLEIVSGYKVKNVLVEVASRYEACKLILGTNKSFSVGRTRALGRYCLNRLPSTCTVVILDQGEIIFDKKGRLGTDMTRLDMIKVFRRSMRLGRHRKHRTSRVEEEPDDDDDLHRHHHHDHHQHHTTQNNSNKISCKRHQRSSSEIPDYNSISDTTTAELSFGSCSSIILREDSFSNSAGSTTLPRSSTAMSTFEALRISFSNRRAQGGLKAAASASTAPAHRPDMCLLECSKGREKSDSSRSRSSESHGVRGSEVSEHEGAIAPGWPLMHHTIGFEKLCSEEKFARVGTLVEHVVDPSSSPKGWFWVRQGEEEEVGVRETTTAMATTTATTDPSESRVGRDGSLSGSLAQDVSGVCSNRDCTAFEYEELEEATCRFSQENVVGQGGGSEVFKGTMRDGRTVAVKRLNPGSQAEDELLVDIEISTTLAHEHVVSLLGYCVEDSHMLLVYDYLPEGNLENHLHAPGKDAAVLSWEVRYKVAVGIARALEYLHKGCARPVVHRDVKTSNILLTANFESQLSDFGLAMWAPNKASHLLCNDVVGTFGYLAPEYFMFGRVNDKTDVYAYGVVLLELITGRKPIDTTRPKGEENLVNWARPLLVERAVSTLADPLLGGVYDAAEMSNMVVAAFLALQQSAQQRPRMSQVLQVLSGDQDKPPSMCASKLDVISPSDPEEEVDAHALAYGCGDDTTVGDNIRSHLALAMMGVDDDGASQCSMVDFRHSSKYLEEYLEGRFSRSASFED